MGLGAAMTGGNPRHGRQENDWYPTPPEVTRALLREVDFGRGGVVMEPAAGDYAMAAEIEAAGYTVFASDINPRDPRVREGDFFACHDTHANTIITNPPFKLAERFITHSLDTLKVDNLALVLKATYWHAVSRSDLFRRLPPSYIMAMNWRPDFLKKGAPTMDCIWSVWMKDHVGPTEYHILSK